MPKDFARVLWLFCTLLWVTPCAALTDYDGDGKSDMAFIRRGWWSTVPVLFSNGDGSWRATNFALPSDASWANQPGVIAIPGNYSADGRTGIAFIRPGCDWSTVPVLFSNGEGSWRATNFALPSDASWANQPGAIAVRGSYSYALPKSLTVIGIGDQADQDDNGFVINPIWGYQRNNNLQSPKVSDVCFNYNRAADWTTALATCTDDSITVDTQKTSTLQGSCTPGHYNWSLPVTYQGTIFWDSHSTGSTIFQIGGDDDYNVRFVASNANLRTADNLGWVTGEFDSDETVDWWGKGCSPNNDWWQCFHAKVDDSDQAARDQMDGLDAVAIGQLTIDGNNYHAFNSAQSELHPVWALMIHTNPAVDDDTWAFFVRNSGDEGYCGNSQHQLFTAPAGQPQPLSFFLPMPGVRGLHFLPSTKVNAGAGQSHLLVPPITTNVLIGGGAILTFNLDDPAERSWIEGELHIGWEANGSLAARRPQSLRLSVVDDAAARGAREPEAEGPIPAEIEANSRT